MITLVAIFSSGRLCTTTIPRHADIGNCGLSAFLGDQIFKIDLGKNRIDAVEKRTFSELRLRERENLQEWIAHTPEALGEELLIIQKEFAGFDGTQERLDLLALDRSGRLVVIENKLDDSGRDVIWQALKYAAYCSTLKTGQIIEIYMRHIGESSREDAVERLSGFLQDADSEELVLNPAGSQRIILVAARFRREVTATALWLLGKGVSISCFQVAPYQSGDELFLDVQQIIPTPETADYMIQLADKSASDDQAATAEASRYKRRREYWKALLAEASARGVEALARRSPHKDNWMTAACGTSGIQYSLIITEKEARAQFEFVSPDKLLNKALFDYMRTQETQIETALGAGVIWRRMDEAKSSRIALSQSVDFLDRETWPEIIDWHLSSLFAWEKAMAPVLPQLAEMARKA